MQTETQTRPATGETTSIVVNGVQHRMPDKVVDARTILRIAGFNPPSDHILIQLTRPGTRSIGLDEQVDLTPHGAEAFHAFHTDRAFNFTVNETGYEWGAGEISEPELRVIAAVADGEVIMVERKNARDEILTDGTVLKLSERGTEHLYTKARLVTVTYGDDEKRFELEPREYSGAELADIFKIPCGYVVDLIVNGGFEIILPDQKLRVKDGMHFISQPGKGASS